jgi:hypothetical protein
LQAALNIAAASGTQTSIQGFKQKEEEEEEPVSELYFRKFLIELSDCHRFLFDDDRDR